MSDQISAISFRNYKGFEDATVDLKSLSILIGANSTGKSAILKLILLISQSISSTNSALFTFNGPLVEIGSATNIYPRFKKDVKMDVEFHFSNPINASTICHSYYSSFRMHIRRELYELQGPDDVKYLARSLRERLSKSVDHSAMEEAADLLARYATLPDDSELMDEESAPLKDYNGLAFATRLCNRLSSEKISSVLFKIRHNEKTGEPTIAKTIIRSSNEDLIEYRLTNHKNLGARLGVAGIDPKTLTPYYKKIKEATRAVSFRFVRRGDIRFSPSQMAIFNPIGILFGSFLTAATRPIYQSFNDERVRHVSPLRAYPRRYYLLDGRDYNNTPTAEAERIVAILRAHPDAVTEINLWLARLGQEVELEQVNDSIFKIMVKSGEVNCDLTDVGFGLSQMLPVILEPIVSSTGDLLIIQQPEIHLHPKAQSILADFFVWAIKNKGCKLLIETHSEYILRRLRRRLAEGVFRPDESHGIPPSMVSLMSIQKTSGASSIDRLVFQPNGDFKWPSDFLDEEVDDLLAFIDITAESHDSSIIMENKE